jgi:DNA-binding HxlR family transcriptional regulator
MSGRLDYRVFQDTARRLNDRGLISRIDHGTEGVSYELTADGRSVLSMLEGVETWIDGHPETAARVPRTSPSSQESADADHASPAQRHGGTGG